MAYVSCFCTSSAPPSSPAFPILPFQNPFTSSSKIKGRNAYRAGRISGIILCSTVSAGLIFAGIALSIPRTASAFWPFSVTNADGNSTPVLHDPSINLMAAPLSTEVDDTVGGPALTTSDGTALVPGGDDSDDQASSGDSEGDTVTAPSNGTISQYTVKAGDSLSGIAQSFGVSVNTILWANDIKDPSTIKQGTVLVILPVSGIQHTVRSGETLSSIAAKFGADAGDIAQFNGISADSALTAGSTIIIPGGELPSESSDTTTNTKSSKSSKNSTSSTKKSSSKTTESSSSDSDSESESSSLHCDYSSGNPCHGINGSPLRSFFTNPLPGAMVSQGLHGWDAVDLAAPAGTPIVAAADGSVILSRMGGWNGGYGNYVILANSSGVETLYAHMTQTKATVGDTVSAGEVIGYVGMTGDATGDHLHFEVRGAQNPFAFCSERMSDSSCFNP